MPFTFRGCGTKFYGKRDEGPDGSYITTEWITLVYLPLIPLRSFRVCPTGGGTNAILYRSEQFRVQKVPLNKLQVRNIYAVSGPIIALIVAVLIIGARVEESGSGSLPLPAYAELDADRHYI